MLNPRRAAAQLVGRHAIGFAINFAGTIFFARTLGPAAWGIYNVAFVVQFIGQGVLERGVVGHLIQRRDLPDREVLSVSFTVELAVATGLAALVAIGAGPAAMLMGESSLRVFLLAAGVSLIPYGLRAVPLGLLERDLAYTRVAAVEVSDVAVFVLVSVAGILGGLGFVSLAVAMIARSVVSMIVVFAVTRVRPSLGWSQKHVRELWAFVGPYSGANALSYLNGAAAPILVGTLAGPRELGVLQLAYSLVAYPQVLNGILGRVAFPFYARIGEDSDRVRRSASNATSQLIEYVGGLTVVLAASSPIWVPILYGPDWAGVPQIMLTVAPTLAVGTSLTFVIAGLNAAGRTKAILRTSTAFSLVYWIAAILLVPRIGALGLPVAYAFASMTFIGYLIDFRASVGRIEIRGALAAHLIQATLVVVVAVFLTLGEASGVALAAAAAIAWTSRRPLRGAVALLVRRLYFPRLAARR